MRMPRLHSVFATAVLLTAVLTAPGATYYVATTGSDTAAGTPSAPWQTIQKAADAMVAGDTVLVQPGIYNQRVKTKASGTSLAPITFKANGSVTNYGFIINHSFITVDGFDITANPAIANFEGVFEISRQLNSINIMNNHIHDFDAINTRITGIHFNYASNAAMATANCVISNNVLRNTSYIMMSLNCSNAIVCSNVFDFANSHDAIVCFGAKITISGNLFTNISANPSVPDHTDIIQTFGNEPSEAYDILFERNLVVNSEAQLCQLEQKGRPNIRDWTFRNNVWANVRMAGNVDIENCNWYNNTFYRCTQTTGGPILLNCNIKGCASNAQVVNNIFFECGSIPSSKDMGWYHPENTSFVFFADYNFVCGADGAAKNPLKFIELHGINGGDPKFVNPAALDFRLRPDSPLIGRGLRLSGFADDFLGVTRSADAAWDIGAIQSGNVSVPHAPTGLKVLP